MYRPTPPAPTPSSSSSTTSTLASLLIPAAVTATAVLGLALLPPVRAALFGASAGEGPGQTRRQQRRAERRAKKAADEARAQKVRAADAERAKAAKRLFSRDRVAPIQKDFNALVAKLTSLEARAQSLAEGGVDSGGEGGEGAGAGTGKAISAYYAFPSSTTGKKEKSKWDSFDVDAELKKVDDDDDGDAGNAGEAGTRGGNGKGTVAGVSGESNAAAATAAAAAAAAAAGDVRKRQAELLREQVSLYEGMVKLQLELDTVISNGKDLIRTMNNEFNPRVDAVKAKLRALTPPEAAETS